MSAEHQEIIDNKVASNAALKAKMLRYYASEGKDALVIQQEEPRFLDRIEGMERRLHTMEAHSAVYMEEIDRLKLAALDEKISAHLATPGECLEHECLGKQAHEMYSLYVIEAIERQEMMECEYEGEENSWGNVTVIGELDAQEINRETAKRGIRGDTGAGRES